MGTTSIIILVSDGTNSPVEWSISITLSVGCHSSCLSCDGPTSSECVECASDLHLQGNQCVLVCSDGFTLAEDGECVQCDYRCQLCYGTTNAQCEMCKEGVYLWQQQCVEQCPQGYYGDVDMTCKQCHHMCKECFGPLSYQCLSCNPLLHFVQNRCIEAQCPQGAYIQFTGIEWEC